MSAAVSLVLVTYRSGPVVAPAVASFRRESRAAGIAGEVVIVDHSEDAAELRALSELAPDVLVARPNRGYAAGVNEGMAHATGGVAFVGNPDIVFLPGSVAALAGALAAGREIVGPQFVIAGLQFPPADGQRPRDALRRYLASRSAALWRREVRSELARWRRVWEAGEPVAVPLLSGALLAFGSAAWRRVGPWDDGYFLYFEETDWELRARRAGLRTALVPAARVEHQWGHAAALTATGAHFARSRARFLARHHGLAGRVATRLVPDRLPVRPATLPDDDAALPRGRAWWLVSPTDLGLPAVGLLGTAAEVRAAMAAAARRRGDHSPLLVTAVEPRGRGAVRGPWRWSPAGPVSARG